MQDVHVSCLFDKKRPLELHAFSSYKKRLYKKPLVQHPKCKKQRLVDIVKTKKLTSTIAPFFEIFKSFFLLFPKIFNQFDIFKKQRLYKVEKLRNKNCIKDAKN